jgi:hypothetical protein
MSEFDKKKALKESKKDYKALCDYRKYKILQADQLLQHQSTVEFQLISTLNGLSNYSWKLDLPAIFLLAEHQVSQESRSMKAAAAKEMSSYLLNQLADIGKLRPLKRRGHCTITIPSLRSAISAAAEKLG